MNSIHHKLIVGQFHPITISALGEIDEARGQYDRVRLGIRSNLEVSYERVRRDVMGHYAKKVLVCGLSGSGKTTLCNELAPMLGAIHLNNDAIRDGPHNALGWSQDDRVEHAHRVGQWADMLTQQGYTVLVDMICPLVGSRNALNPDYTVFVDTVSKSKYEDTDGIFQPPDADYRVTSQKASIWAGLLYKELDTRIEIMPLTDVTKIIDID